MKTVVFMLIGIVATAAEEELAKALETRLVLGGPRDQVSLDVVEQEIMQWTSAVEGYEGSLHSVVDSTLGLSLAWEDLDSDCANEISAAVFYCAVAERKKQNLLSQRDDLLEFLRKGDTHASAGESSLNGHEPQTVGEAISRARSGDISSFQGEIFEELAAQESAWDFRAACVESPQEMEQRFESHAIHSYYRDALTVVQSIERCDVSSLASNVQRELQDKRESLAHMCSKENIMDSSGADLKRDKEGRVVTAWQELLEVKSDKRVLRAREMADEFFQYVVARSKEELREHALLQVRGVMSRIKACDHKLQKGSKASVLSQKRVGVI